MNITANLEKTAALLPDQIEDSIDLIGTYDGTVITPVW